MSKKLSKKHNKYKRSINKSKKYKRSVNKHNKYKRSINKSKKYKNSRKKTKKKIRNKIQIGGAISNYTRSTIVYLLNMLNNEIELNISRMGCSHQTPLQIEASQEQLSQEPSEGLPDPEPEGLPEPEPTCFNGLISKFKDTFRKGKTGGGPIDEISPLIESDVGCLTDDEFIQSLLQTIINLIKKFIEGKITGGDEVNMNMLLSTLIKAQGKGKVKGKIKLLKLLKLINRVTEQSGTLLNFQETGRDVIAYLNTLGTSESVPTYSPELATLQSPVSYDVEHDLSTISGYFKGLEVTETAEEMKRIIAGGGEDQLKNLLGILIGNKEAKKYTYNEYTGKFINEINEFTTIINRVNQQFTGGFQVLQLVLNLFICFVVVAFLSYMVGEGRLYVTQRRHRRRQRRHIEEIDMEVVPLMEEEEFYARLAAAQKVLKLGETFTSKSHPLYICPITQKVMYNPVVAEDGRTYEKSAILRWLSSGNTTSPITRERIGKVLTVNWDLNSDIKNTVDNLVAEAKKVEPKKKGQESPFEKTYKEELEKS